MRNPVLFLFFSLVDSFLFDTGPEINHCYELDLENCFREAFLAVIHPPTRIKKAPNSSHNTTITDKRKDSPTFLLCHDVRRFSSCFLFPGCSDHLAAAIASVQYHMVFGKKLPIHVFLAYKGFGTYMCQQSCSSESYLSCRKTITKEDLDEEQRLLLEASSLSVDGADPGVCEKLEQIINRLISLRRRDCDGLTKCTCQEPVLKHGIAQCNIKCEVLHLNSHELQNSALIHVQGFVILGILGWHLTNYLASP